MSLPRFCSIALNKLIITGFILTCSLGYGQIDIPGHHTQNKWRVGGNIGLNFGSDSYFGFSIAPSVGYEITPRFLAGVTVGYQYSKWDTAKQNLFNTGPFLNFYPLRSIFLRAHYEYYTGRRSYKDYRQAYNFDENALWLGGGYSQQTGPVRIHVGLMYNVLYEEEGSLFSNGLRPIAGVSFRI